MGKRRLYQIVLADSVQVSVDDLVECVVDEKRAKTPFSANKLMQETTTVMAVLENTTLLCAEIVFSPLVVEEFKKNIQCALEKAKKIKDEFRRDRAVSLIETLLDSF